MKKKFTILINLNTQKLFIGIYFDELQGKEGFELCGFDVKSDKNLLFICNLCTFA